MYALFISPDAASRTSRRLLQGNHVINSETVTSLKRGAIQGYALRITSQSGVVSFLTDEQFEAYLG